MPRRRQSVAAQTEFDVLSGRIHALQGAVRAINQAKMTVVQVVDIDNFNEPLEGMVCVDWPTKRFCWYHDDVWICVPANATHAIKVFGDKKQTTVEDGVFRFSVERDLDDSVIVDAAAFLGTAASGNTVIQVSNRTRGLDILSTPLTIPGGSYDSYGVFPSINTGGPVANPNNRVVLGDRIWIDVDTAGAGGRGLGVYLTFMPFRDPQSDVA